MPRENSDTSSDWNQRQRALSRWDNEGGAGPMGPPRFQPDNERTAVPELTNAELVTLRIRVIALENLMISLLATASDDQLRLAREMAGYISPRPGFTQHPLTIHAAAHMVDLVERANHFRDFEFLIAPACQLIRSLLLRREQDATSRSVTATQVQDDRNDKIES